jgi:hypothetical protein
MNKKEKIAIVVAVIGAAGAVIAAFVTGMFTSKDQPPKPQISQTVSVGTASGDVTVVGTARDVTVNQPPVAKSAPTDPYTIDIIQSGASGLVNNRFTFPYSDIEKKRQYREFSELLGNLPGAKFDQSQYTIFLTRDESVLAPSSNITAIENGNMGVLVIPNSVVTQLGGNHLAVTYVLSQIRK